MDFFSFRRSGERIWAHARHIGISCVLFFLSTILANADGVKTMANTTYSVAVKTVDSFQVYYIQQNEKAVAEILPALGNNCYAFRVADGDTWLNLIDAPPDLATLEAVSYTHLTLPTKRIV